MSRYDSTTASFRPSLAALRIRPTPSVRANDRRSAHLPYTPHPARHGFACTRARILQKRGSGGGAGRDAGEEGGADGEVGGDSPSSSAKLQLVSVLRRGKCGGAAAATGWEGTIGGAGRLGRIGLLRFDPAEPAAGGSEGSQPPLGAAGEGLGG